MDSKLQVISLISGKGGVGKTSVAASLSFLLNRIDYKILLIDCDLATYGLSYFFIDQIESSNCTDLSSLVSNPDSITQIKSVELDKQNHEKSNNQKRFEFVKIDTNLYLLPSISKFTSGQNEHDEDVFTPGKSNNIKNILQKIINNFGPEFDVVILDAQAGVSQTSAACLSVSSSVITVVESDPVSMWAVKNLERRLAIYYPNNSRVFYLANKLFFDEVAQYKAISSYLRSISHLPPLPFDFEVRKAFAHRKIPINLEIPTPFLFALLRIIPDLLSRAEEKIMGLEKSLFDRALDPINQEKAKIERKIKGIQENLDQMSRFRKLNLSVLFGVLTFIMIVTLLFPELMSGMQFGVSSLLIVFTTVMFIGFVILQTDIFSGIVRRLLGIKQVSHTSKEVLLKEMEDLLERRRSIDTLILTKSDELLFKPQQEKQ